MIFRDRKEAGERLAKEIQSYNINDPYLVALPKGGIKVANEVARILGIKLSSLVIKNINYSNHPEVSLCSLEDMKDLQGKTVILIGDGMATGNTSQVCIEYLRLFNPEDIYVAAPVCSPDALDKLEENADKVICLYTPIYFNGVNQWYRNMEESNT